MLKRIWKHIRHVFNLHDWEAKAAKPMTHKVTDRAGNILELTQGTDVLYRCTLCHRARHHWIEGVWQLRDFQDPAQTTSADEKFLKSLRIKA